MSAIKIPSISPFTMLQIIFNIIDKLAEVPCSALQFGCDVYIPQVALLSSSTELFYMHVLTNMHFYYLPLKSNKPIQARSLHICTYIFETSISRISSIQNAVVLTVHALYSHGWM
jgi:hypothetical protein